MASRPRTALVIHGGFWKPQYDASLMDAVCADLRDRGWDAVNVEYRRGEGWPPMAEDLLAAYDEARPDVAVGHSAGGQLAVWLAAQRPLRGVVSQAGVLDLEAARPLSGGVVDQVFGEHIAAASPMNLHVDGRVLCVHGSADPDVPVSVSERYAAKHGAELAVFEGEGHYGHIDPAHPMWHRAADWLDAIAR